MDDFVFNLPVNLVFGRGKVNEIGELCKPIGKKALIVTGRSSTKKTGLLGRIEEKLKSVDIEHIVFDKIMENPHTTIVEEGASIAKEEECDFVIGVGGGSAMDAAKAVAFKVLNEGSIIDYIFGRKKGNESLPLVMITTTSGTGSEGDSISVLTDPVSNDKKAIKNPSLYPKISILDPELMVTMPKKVIASTGFDALAHCIEAYLSKNSNFFSDFYALKGIELIFENLVEVYNNPKNLDSWDYMVLANAIGGMVIDQSGIVLPHAMEHPVSGLLNIAHGQGLAAIFPSFMSYSIKGNEGKFKEIAKAMGNDVVSLSNEGAAQKSIDLLVELLAKIDLDITLSEFGVSEDSIEWLVENAFKVSSHGINNSPRVPDEAELTEIYRACL